MRGKMRVLIGDPPLNNLLYVNLISTEYDSVLERLIDIYPGALVKNLDVRGDKIDLKIEINKID